MPTVEESVKNFYNSYGWKKSGAASGEDKLFRRFSPGAEKYHEAVRERLEGLFPPDAEALLVAGGGDMPESHRRIAARFSSVACVDISERAIEAAQRHLGTRADCRVGSILDLPFDDGVFDAVLAAHVIYHIDADQQETAMRELVRVLKPGGRAVVIYSNPRNLPSRLIRWGRRLMLNRNREFRDAATLRRLAENPLYFHHHPIEWWRRFEPSAHVEIRPWNAMSSEQDLHLLRADWISRAVYAFCSAVERVAPGFAARNWTYPIFVLTKPV